MDNQLVHLSLNLVPCATHYNTIESSTSNDAAYSLNVAEPLKKSIDSQQFLIASGYDDNCANILANRTLMASNILNPNTQSEEQEMEGSLASPIKMRRERIPVAHKEENSLKLFSELDGWYVASKRLQELTGTLI